jgi:hypothetical protein
MRGRDQVPSGQAASSALRASRAVGRQATIAASLAVRASRHAGSVASPLYQRRISGNFSRGSAMRSADGTSPATEKSAIVSRSPTSQVLPVSESLSTAAKRAKFCSPRAIKAGVPMSAFPGEPAQNICLTPQIRRPEPRVGALGRHVKQNCVGLPENETVILKRWHFLVGIDGEVLRAQLVAASEVNGLHLAVEGEMIFQGHDAENAWRWRKEVEFQFHKLEGNAAHAARSFKARAVRRLAPSLPPSPR